MKPDFFVTMHLDYDQIRIIIFLCYFYSFALCRFRRLEICHVRPDGALNFVVYLKVDMLHWLTRLKRNRFHLCAGSLRTRIELAIKSRQHQHKWRNSRSIGGKMQTYRR
jgi:hypothetical protein